MDFVGTVIHSKHNANTVFYKLRGQSTHNECSISLDFVGTTVHTTQTECSISFGSLDFVGTVINSTHNANTVFYKLWKLGLCRDSNTQYTQRKQSVL